MQRTGTWTWYTTRGFRQSDRHATPFSGHRLRERNVFLREDTPELCDMTPKNELTQTVIYGGGYASRPRLLLCILV